MEIKKLKYNDFLENIPIIKKLLKLSYNDNFSISDELSEATIKTKIHELDGFIKSRKTTLIGIFNENSLIGFIWLHTHEHYGEIRLHINQIVVDDAYRGKGIAKILLLEAEKLAKSLNLNSIDLFVTEENNAAIRMYKESGYITERRFLKKEL